MNLILHSQRFRRRWRMLRRGDLALETEFAVQRGTVGVGPEFRLL